jgi:hypothetical protein
LAERRFRELGAHYMDLNSGPFEVPGQIPRSDTIDAQFELDGLFADAGLTAVSCAGVAPGWVDLAARRAVEDLSAVETITVRWVEWNDGTELISTVGPGLIPYFNTLAGPRPDPRLHRLHAPGDADDAQPRGRPRPGDDPRPLVHPAGALRGGAGGRNRERRGLCRLRRGRGQPRQGFGYPHPGPDRISGRGEGGDPVGQPHGLRDRGHDPGRAAADARPRRDLEDRRDRRRRAAGVAGDPRGGRSARLPHLGEGRVPWPAPPAESLRPPGTEPAPSRLVRCAASSEHRSPIERRHRCSTR